MTYNEWRQQILDRLVHYKTSVLGIPGSGYFKGKKEDHILPRGAWRSNFMCDISRIKYKKHEGFHHLNSSQTMCVNFFAPLVENDSRLLGKLLSFIFDDEITVDKDSIEFEHVDKQNCGDTNFDFFCRDKRGEEYYFEIKYTEEGFAKRCSSDNQGDEYLLGVFQRKYAPLIEQEGSFLKNCLNEPMVFMTEHYQAFRNLAVANETRKRHCIFLTMKGNEATYQDLKLALEYVGGENRYIKSLYWEDVIDSLLYRVKISEKHEGLHGDLRGYYLEFKEKYSC